MFLTNLILNIDNDYDKLYIYSPSVHQALFQKLNKGFSIYVPIHILLIILNDEDIDVVIDEMVNKKTLKNMILKWKHLIV